MRKEGWEKLLYDHLKNPPSFQWGHNDCALWSSDWVFKATGKDFSTDWRGKYTTEAELHALMTARGFASAADIACHNLPKIPVTFAQRGDIVLHPQGCLGICEGTMSYFLTETGITRLPTPKCPAAWKVD